MKMKLVIVLVTAVLGCRSVARQPDALHASASAPAGIDDFLTNLHSMSLAPGFVVMIIKDTTILYARGFGVADVATRAPITPQSIFYIASVTKAFTALAAATAASHGQLDLDAPVSRYIALPFKAPLSGDSITLRMLLTHTHGVKDGPISFVTTYLGGEHRIPELLPQHGAVENRRAYAYSNIGYNLAGVVLNAATRTHWKQLEEDYIFHALGMRSTTGYSNHADPLRLVQPHVVAPVGFRQLKQLKNDSTMHAAGGHFASAEDLARFVIANMHNGQFRGHQAIPADAVVEAHKMQVPMRDTTRWYQPFGYGLGWELGSFNQDTLHVATGGFVGYASHVSFSKTRRTGVIALVNESTYGSALLDAAVRAAYAAAYNQGDQLAALVQRIEPYRGGVTRRRAALQNRTERVAAVRPLSLPADKYAGTYTNWMYGVLEVTDTAGRLFAKLGPLESAGEVRTAGADTIRVELVPNEGRNILFLPGANSVDSLRYLGTVFRRRH